MNLSRIPFLERNLFWLVHIKGFIKGFGKTYYSQGGEDVILGQLLTQKEGVYVDVGAYHPFHYSNTYCLYKKGWRGVNIDPNPRSINLFNLHRSRDINVQRGISQKKEEKAYYVFNHQSCNTFSEEQKRFMEKKKFITLLGEEKVLCEPLRDILKEHAVEKIDLLNIDVEGLNKEVLESFDWGGVHPGVICIEDDHFSTSASGTIESSIFNLLSSKGYVLYAVLGLSCVYTKSYEG